MIMYSNVGDMKCYASSSFWVDLLVDVLFWGDTILNFFFAFVDEETKIIVANRKAIRAQVSHATRSPPSLPPPP